MTSPLEFSALQKRQASFFGERRHKVAGGLEKVSHYSFMLVSSLCRRLCVLFCWLSLFTSLESLNVLQVDGMGGKTTENSFWKVFRLFVDDGRKMREERNNIKQRRETDCWDGKGLGKLWNDNGEKISSMRDSLQREWEKVGKQQLVSEKNIWIGVSRKTMTSHLKHWEVAVESILTILSQLSCVELRFSCKATHSQATRWFSCKQFSHDALMWDFLRRLIAHKRWRRRRRVKKILSDRRHRAVSECEKLLAKNCEASTRPVGFTSTR